MTREHHIKIAVLLHSLLLSPLNRTEYHEKRRQLGTLEGIQIGQLPRDAEFGFETSHVPDGQ
jgi:hypothetical protein